MIKTLYKRILLLVVLLAPVLLFAQRTVSGVVTDAENGEPLIGANILITGTGNGTITDIDGMFSLEVPEGYDQLTISYTGYADKELTLGVDNQLVITMAPGEVLDEIVVIGYGTVRRQDATGAVATVSSEDFNKGAITSPQQLVAGKIAGVQITTGGEPGAGASIRIRGGSSLSASNDPLIVIDGVPIDNSDVAGGRNPLNLINPNDIETFTVLKDASSTAIYGSRASNGVILITTKKGSYGQKLQLNYNGNISFSRPIDFVEVFSADEYRTLINETYAEGHPARGLLGNANTNWQEEIFNTGVGTDHNLSASGAFGFVPYRLSVGYTNMDGVLETAKFNRTTLALNLNPSFMDNRLQVKFGLKSMFNNNRFANQGAIGSAVVFDPTQAILDPASPYEGYYTWTDANGVRNTLAPANPLALLNLTDNRSDVQRYIVNGNVDYRFGFLPELRANLNLAYDYSSGEGTNDIPGTASFAFDQATGGGVMNRYSSTQKNELLEFYLNYLKDFGLHKLDIMGGYSWQRFFNESSFFNSNINGTETQEGDDAGELYLVSLFGRLNYNINNRYLFTFTLRRDGTSRFSPDSRWGLFPAAAFAWKAIDREEGALSSLKLRLGYGVTGQQGVGGYYDYLPRYQASFNDARYQFGNTYYTTLRPNGYNANLKWEETTTYNAGIDFGIIDQKVTGSIDYYFRQTDDLLNFVRIPAGTNLTNFINSNVGSLENTGVELTLNFVPYQNDEVIWDLSVNAAYNNNKITRLLSSDDPEYIGVQVGGISGGVGNTIQVHSVDFPASSYLVFEQVYDESGTPIEGLYVDRNGDGIVNNEDLYRLEKPAPDWIFGLYSSVNIKDFTLSFAGRANVGHYIYNNVYSNNAALNNLYASTNYLLNVPTVATTLDMNVPQYFSDHFIQEGSFFRMDHITLTYNFSNLSDKMGLSLSAVVQNPFMVTDYVGIDPEIASGIDSNIYPRARTFVFGANVRF